MSNRLASESNLAREKSKYFSLCKKEIPLCQLMEVPFETIVHLAGLCMGQGWASKSTYLSVPGGWTGQVIRDSRATFTVRNVTYIFQPSINWLPSDVVFWSLFLLCKLC